MKLTELIEAAAHHLQADRSILKLALVDVQFRKLLKCEDLMEKVIKVQYIS